MFRTTVYWDNPKPKSRPKQRHNFGGSGRGIEIERHNFRRSIKENEGLSSDR
jgi:hypothetical protein